MDAEWQASIGRCKGPRLKQITALISPDATLAYRILALNTEKAHTCGIAAWKWFEWPATWQSGMAPRESRSTPRSSNPPNC